MRVELILGAHLFIGERAVVAVRYKYVDIEKEHRGVFFFLCVYHCCRATTSCCRKTTHHLVTSLPSLPFIVNFFCEAEFVFDSYFRAVVKDSVAGE